MTNYKAPVTDLSFLLKHLVNADELWRSLGLTEADSETVNAILDEAAKLCEQVIAPLNREADEQGCRLDNGKVVVPEGFSEAYSAYCEGGWGTLGGDPNFGGMGMPKTLVACVEEMFQGSCMAFGLAPMLTAGACLALSAHGSEALKSTYLPKMYSGEWSGSMDLTEPHSGTDLGLIRTRAKPNGEGSYKISGTKIFITWGDHEMAENIIHLVLAKLPGAPDNAKGISLFLVPKFILNEDGSLGKRNALSCGALEKKMGINASATCVMNFDGAKGWLVGEPNKGLSAMFTMMNYERLTVGIQGVGVAEASYQAARDYAKERLQGRALTGAAEPQSPADPLIVHPDVRRMLLHMRVFNEASRAFYLYVASHLDIAKFSENLEDRTKSEGRIALLTPVAKAFMTDMALSATIEGQQIFGGHGFIREWGQEQHVRDVRITQIYEGANGIQALDLMGRKIVGNKAHWLKDYCHEIVLYTSDHLENGLKAFGKQLIEYTEILLAVADEVIRRSQKSPDVIGDDAVDFLHALGLVSYGYLWLRMTQAASDLLSKGDFSEFSQPYLEAKLHLCRYFFNRELPRVAYLVNRITSDVGDVMAMPAEQF